MNKTKKYSINILNSLKKYEGGNKMADLGEENKVSGVLGGVEFENNDVEKVNNIENAGTIRNDKLPVKVGFWNKFKSFWLQEIDWNKEIEDEINEFLHQEITWEKVHDFLFQEIRFGKKKEQA